jgi:hypothetical protein
MIGKFQVVSGLLAARHLEKIAAVVWELFPPFIVLE